MKLLRETVYCLVILSLTTTDAYTPTLPVSWLRQGRVFNPVTAVRNWLSGDKPNPTPSTQEYPLWKVHKYNGISLKPVRVIDSSSGISEIVPEKERPPPSVVALPPANYSPPTEYGPPPNEYGPPNTQDQLSSYQETQDSSAGSQNGDTSAALSALDLLGPLSSLLPQNESSSEGDSSGLSSFAGILSSLPDGSIDTISSLLGLINSRSPLDSLRHINEYIEASHKVRNSVVGSLANVLSNIIPGTAEDSQNQAFESGTYNEVPKDYPGRFSIWSRLPFLSSFDRRVPLPKLPEPPKLPKIPLFNDAKDKIEVPKLPHIFFPSNHPVPKLKSKGPYVRISFSKPITASGIPNYEAPETVKPTYGVPEIPKPTYGVPEIPKPIYGVPEVSKPIYGVPEVPKPIYGVQELPKPIYGVPEVPKPIYGVPEVPKPIYGVQELPKPIYGVPEVPKPTYGVPEVPKPIYGVPEASKPIYGLPEVLKPIYGVPEAPKPIYGIQEESKPTYVSEVPNKIYGVPDIPNNNYVIQELPNANYAVPEFGEILTPPVQTPAQLFNSDAYTVPSNSFGTLTSVSTKEDINYFQPSQQITFPQNVYADSQGPSSGHIQFQTPHSFGSFEVGGPTFNTQQTSYIATDNDVFAEPSEQVEEISKPVQKMTNSGYSKVVLHKDQQVRRSELLKTKERILKNVQQSSPLDDIRKYLEENKKTQQEIPDDSEEDLMDNKKQSGETR